MFLIDSRNSDPIFEQIKKQIIRYVNLGILNVDDKLPSVRSLASELGINPNTVSKAYIELEMINVVYSIQKKGVFVAKTCMNNQVDECLDEFEKVLESCKERNIDIKVIDNIIKKVYGGNNDA